MHLGNVPLKYSKYIWTQLFLRSFHFDTWLDTDSLDSSNTTERERGSMAAVISKGLCFLCTLMCSYVAWTSWPLLPHFWRTLQSTAEMLVSQLADITRPGTQRHIFHGTSGQLIHKFCQLLPSQGFHLKGFHGYRPWQGKTFEWQGSGTTGVFKKSERFTEVRDVNDKNMIWVPTWQKTESPSWRRHHLFIDLHDFTLLPTTLPCRRWEHLKMFKRFKLPRFGAFVDWPDLSCQLRQARHFTLCA